MPANIAAPVALPPLVSCATSAAHCPTDRSDNRPNDTTTSSVTSSLVNVPVLSTQRRFSSAIASIADNFCGKTRTCANFNEPNAKSRELASSNPSGITVTADAVIVRSIVTASCPVNRYATRIIPATTTAPYVSHVIARWINRCNGVSSGE